MHRPRTIDLIAPSGYPQQPADAHRGIARLKAEGHHVTGTAVTERRFERFAGSDAVRAADINRLADASRPLPDIVLSIRGGYGAVRLLHGLDYDGLRARLSGAPTVLCGHSDFTAIQMALLSQAGVMSFGGPMLCRNFGAPTLSAFTQRHFWNAVNAPTLEFHHHAPQAQRADVTGTLWGGNLAMLVSLIGTPYLPDIDGGILFVEDVNEHPFRVERMLYQLHLAGVLENQQALILGDFSDFMLSEYDNGYDLHAAVEQIRKVAGIPVITGLPFGHTDDTLTLPVGAPARLVAGPTGFTLSVSGYPHAT